MAWYYDNCYRCNENGSFNNVDPSCPVCSGIGKDWGKGDDQRQKLRSIFGREPLSGTPPEYNYFGKKVYSSNQIGSTGSSVADNNKTESEPSGCLITFIFIVYSAASLHIQQVYFPEIEFWKIWLSIPLIYISGLIIWAIRSSSK